MRRREVYFAGPLFSVDPLLESAQILDFTDSDPHINTKGHQTLKVSDINLLLYKIHLFVLLNRLVGIILNHIAPTARYIAYGPYVQRVKMNTICIAYAARRTSPFRGESYWGL